MVKRRKPPLPAPPSFTDLIRRGALPMASRFASEARTGVSERADGATRLLAAGAALLLIGWAAASMRSSDPERTHQGLCACQPVLIVACHGDRARNACDPTPIFVARAQASAAAPQSCRRRPARMAPGSSTAFGTISCGVFLRTYQQINEDRLLAIAAGVVFYGLLSLFRR